MLQSCSKTVELPFTVAHSVSSLIWIPHLICEETVSFGRIHAPHGFGRGSENGGDAEVGLLPDLYHGGGAPAKIIDV